MAGQDHRVRLFGPFVIAWVFSGCGSTPGSPGPDAAVDAATTDAGVADASAMDAGASDAGGRDGGFDASVSDAGPDGGGDAGAHLFDPAAEDPGVWTWIPVPGTSCRDGSPAGLGLRIRPGARNLILFMQGGGACLTPATCDLNRSTFGAADLADWAMGLGSRHIFNPTHPMNPVRDWHAAFIAYCTGDVHGGTRPSADVPGGPTNQAFVGHLNMQVFVTLLSGYFPSLEHVLLVGSSAGGIGTVLNYVQVSEAFAPAPVTLLDDSGPFPPDDAALAPCLQRQMRDLWGLDAALPADCTGCFSTSGDGLSNLFVYLGNTYPERRFALLSTRGDLVVRTLFGLGRNGCDPAIPGPITAQVFDNGLFALRGMLPANWGTYYADGPAHAIIAFLQTLSVDGVPLQNWFSELVAGRVSHVGVP